MPAPFCWWNDSTKEARMFTHELEPEAVADQLGAGGVDNLVANAERICDYQQKHIELTNQGTILGLEGEFNDLVREERRIEI